MPHASRLKYLRRTFFYFHAGRARENVRVDLDPVWCPAGVGRLAESSTFATTTVRREIKPKLHFNSNNLIELDRCYSSLKDSPQKESYSIQRLPLAYSLLTWSATGHAEQLGPQASGKSYPILMTRLTG